MGVKYGLSEFDGAGIQMDFGVTLARTFARTHPLMEDKKGELMIDCMIE